MKKTAEPTTGKASAVNSNQPLPHYIDILLLPRLQNAIFGVHLDKCTLLLEPFFLV